MALFTVPPNCRWIRIRSDGTAITSVDVMSTAAVPGNVGPALYGPNRHARRKAAKKRKAKR